MKVGDLVRNKIHKEFGKGLIMKFNLFRKINFNWKLRKGYKLDHWEQGKFKKCPDCGGTKFWEGAQGGVCTNFKCANDECGAKFNVVSIFGVDRLSYGKGKIEKEKE